MSDIQLGDIGIIVGRAGSFCVRGGAELPSNIVPCNHGAREAAEAADVLSMHDGTMCWRHEFIPMHLATREQREMAGIYGWYEAVRHRFLAY